ncbi:MAG: cytochrome c [Ignavibacteria bacterium]|nr:cytochrome c [Ignavibacteria bacterium]MCC7159533.1 cytochrome c [Ignavibacteria bacterium]
MKINIKLTTKVIAVILPILLFAISLGSCGVKEEYGIGPVKEEMKLEPINDKMVARGKEIFDVKCIACHKFDVRLVGPPLKDVTKRRRPEWIMNQILNPIEMTQKDQTSKELFAQYLVQMTFQDVSHPDARALLEYFRAVDENKVTP